MQCGLRSVVVVQASLHHGFAPSLQRCAGTLAGKRLKVRHHIYLWVRGALAITAKGAEYMSEQAVTILDHKIEVVGKAAANGNRNAQHKQKKMLKYNNFFVQRA